MIRKIKYLRKTLERIILLEEKRLEGETIYHSIACEERRKDGFREGCACVLAIAFVAYDKTESFWSKLVKYIKGGIN